MFAFSIWFSSLIPVTVASVTFQAKGDKQSCHTDNILLQMSVHRAKEISVETRDTQSSWTTSIKERRHLDYDGVRDKKRQLDIYWPDAPVPAGGWLTVVAVHGLKGNKQTFRHLCQVIALTGRLC